MTSITRILETASELIWGPFTLALLLLVGIYLSIGLRLIPWRKIPAAFSLLSEGRIADKSNGEIPPFQALMTALSATVGTGNIAGVATAIALGGPGAIFWMWITAAFGMATKYAEAALAVKYRATDESGQYVGGPMYYIRNGLGKHWAWLGGLFALFGMIAAFGIGNLVQANSVTEALRTAWKIPYWLIATVMTGLTAIVILGGVKRIGEVASFLVPVMAGVYIAGAIYIIGIHIAEVPAVFQLVINNAFNGTAAVGGFAGASMWAAIRFGVARGVFSNEAGLGSAAIAHAAAKTNNPVKQGLIAMLGVFIDTLVICTLTALVILLSGVWNSGKTGAMLSVWAFQAGWQGGGLVVAFGLCVFAFTTILGWSYYGERCAQYLFGRRVIIPYRLLWIVMIPIGTYGKLEFIWLLADVMNGLMALPNLIALVALSPVVFKITRRYFST
ncbi:MAG TPA: sodium:alanine symporter family protein [Crenotrichaceae bacterium]|nr:sodium:alanine symporter family protein [Crenotrichaceae bacterium]